MIINNNEPTNDRGLDVEVSLLNESGNDSDICGVDFPDFIDEEILTFGKLNSFLYHILYQRCQLFT